jgi:protein TonB
MRLLQVMDSRIYEPIGIPARVAAITDPPLPAGPMALSDSRSAGDAADIMAVILTPSAPARPAPPVVRTAPPAAPAAPPRVRIGGLVKAAEAIHRVEPVYPALALQLHISGVVELEGVVGVDGRIRELKPKSGHPLLIRAALEAVAQWLFRPTTLNGEPVEVVQPVVVRFNLK